MMQHLQAPNLIPLKQIVKRDGRRVSFEISRITQAILACLNSLTSDDEKYALQYVEGLALKVVDDLTKTFRDSVSVEQVQDAVERTLLAEGLYDEAKAYILYRANRASQRGPEVSVDHKNAFEEAAQFFNTPLQQFQFFDKYSRFNNDLSRRETWIETVDRGISFLKELAKGKIPDSVFVEIRTFMLEMRAFSSMRLLAMAGAAARRNNVCIYNCSFVGVDSLDAFVEALIISMCGCGVGFSVESVFTDELPEVTPQMKNGGTINFIVGDSAEGWASALRTGLTTWMNGGDVEFDYSYIRPAGAVLRTKGGRASGPEPLKKMLAFIRAKILSRQGRKLRPIDAHDIMCTIGDCAVQGGVRRTAMISLFDFDDQEMLKAKHGEFWNTNPQRRNANNSAVIPDEPLTQKQVVKLMLAMDKSGSGEPGIFIRRNTRKNRPPRRADYEYFGVNPCGEIILRSMQFCNLSIAVARPDDTLEDLKAKVRVAAIIGTIQSCATYFPGLRKKWKDNCEEERLLGVDITGQMDRQLTEEEMVALREEVVATNKKYAEMLGINQSAATTCVKPSGNSSVLVNCSPGLNPRWSKYQIRNVRVMINGPIYKVLKDANVPMEPDLMAPTSTAVVSFPVKAPVGAITRHDVTAVQQCDYWLKNKVSYTEHNPSCTITYKPDELLPLMQWIYDNQEVIGGMAFLPASDAIFPQMPNEEITEEEYNKLAGEFPKVDWSSIAKFEDEDYTTAAQELACLAGACEII